ncbi:MAG: hypothetical protein P8X95_27125 [Anaerolineales bacterium]
MGQFKIIIIQLRLFRAVAPPFAAEKGNKYDSGDFNPSFLGPLWVIGGFSTLVV